MYLCFKYAFAITLL